MGQQFYVIRRNPAPGTPAYEAWEARRRAKGKDLRLATVTGPEPTNNQVVEQSTPPKVARQQPRKQTRAQRKT
jgi:YidC/Oxa1 family membrane protein insertase